LIIYFKNKLNIYKKLSLKTYFIRKQTYVKYSLDFVSLLSPTKINNIKFLLNIGGRGLQFNSNKTILIKQSYILLTWIYYILKFYKSHEIKTIPTLFIKPLKLIKFTSIKSPMAHKTFSQEQFLIKYFKLKISFKIPYFFFFPNFSNSILFIFVLKQSLNFFESNFFFLKKINIKLNKNIIKIFLN